MWCSTWRQHPVDFAGFLENFSGVIFQRGAFVKMYSDRELPSIHLDDRWRCPKQLCVVREVLHSQSSWHDQKLHRHTFLQRWVEWLKSNTVQDNVIHAVCNSPKILRRSRVSYLVSERDDARQQSDEDVCVHAPFVSLIYDDRTVSLEQEILWDETERVKHRNIKVIKGSYWDVSSFKVTLNHVCYILLHDSMESKDDTFWISFSRTPSVMNLILVSLVTFPSYRIWYDTTLNTHRHVTSAYKINQRNMSLYFEYLLWVNISYCVGRFISLATLWDMLTAATLLGSVIPIIPLPLQEEIQTRWR